MKPALFIAAFALAIGCGMQSVDEPSTNMPVPQSPPSPAYFPTTISPPTSFDPLSSAQLNSDVETPLQAGVEAARQLMYGGGIKRRVSCSSNTSMIIQPLGAIMVKVGSTWTVLPNTTPTTIDPSALSGGLGAATRYWVYAKVQAGALAFVVTVDGPDAGLNYRSTDETQIYISTFVTSTANDILTYTQTDNVYTYGGTVATTPNIFINNLGAGVTTKAMGIARPAQARSATVRYLFQIGGGTSTVILTDAADDVTGFEHSGNTVNIGGDLVFIEDTIGVNIADGTGTGKLFAWVKGFTL